MMHGQINMKKEGDISFPLRSSVQCSVFNVQCSVFTVQCSLFSVHCSVFTVQCSVFTVPVCTELTCGSTKPNFSQVGQ